MSQLTARILFVSPILVSILAALNWTSVRTYISTLYRTDSLEAIARDCRSHVYQAHIFSTDPLF